PDFLRQHLFAPLGMRDACVDLCQDERHSLAVRYFRDGSRLPDYRTSHIGASDIRASVDDLARFGMFHLKVLLKGAQHVLPDTAIDEMHINTVPMGGDKSYGIGWIVDSDSGGRRRVSHGGAGAGVDTQLTLYPDQKIVIAVLLNTN